MSKDVNPKPSAKAEATKPGSVPLAEDAEAIPAKVEIVKRLNNEEKQQLEKLEKVIDAKLGDFFEVGSAILQIKSQALFRETHSNFNAYCQDRWGFGRSYANKLIGSAERIRLLPKEVIKPASEFQIRPFLKLEPEEFPKKWQAIVDAAGTGKVTSKIVEDSLDLRKKKRKKRTPKKADQSEGVNELLDGLRTSLKESNVQEAMKQLDRLEKLIRV